MERREMEEQAIQLYLGGMGLMLATRKVGLKYKNSRDPAYRKLFTTATTRKSQLQAKRFAIAVYVFLLRLL